MKKKSLFPQTKVKNPEPAVKDDNWVVWAAWAVKAVRENFNFAIKYPTFLYGKTNEN